MKVIEEITQVVDTDKTEFINSTSKVVNTYQENNLEVDIKYSTSVSKDIEEYVLYSALVIARKDK